MSSVILDRDVFRRAFSDQLAKYRLAGDWLFVGRAMQYGDVAYIPDQLNRFRRHPRTCRTQTSEIRRFAEHLSVQVTLSGAAGCCEDVDILEATRLELGAVMARPGLLEQVMVELEALDHDSAVRLRSVLATHRHTSGGSETPRPTMASTAPFTA
jgi:hypothetical protein